MRKKLNYNEMLEKLLEKYYSYSQFDSGFIGRTFGVSKKRNFVKKAFKFLKKKDEHDIGAELISNAFWFSKKKHLKQKRISGEPYFIHPYNTALYLTELKMGADSIAAGLLHDIVEDTETDIKEIRENFGNEVASLVNSLTKLKQLVAISKKREHNIALQKILFATTKDVRVILIKLADKYHNLKTLDYLSEEKKVRIATNALEFYVPVAKKLGLHELQDEFEKICFKIIKPKIFAKIRKKIKQKCKLKEDEMDLLIKKLEPELKKANLKVSFKKYKRTTYQVFKKMTQNLKSFNEVQDFIVLIALAETREQCYELLGILHNTFAPVPLKFRDHIAISQFSLYQSIHTTIIGPKHTPIKVYIRTKEMDSLIENGVAELLKESKMQSRDFRESVSFLNNLLSINFNDLTADHFIDVLKSDYLQERIFVFNLKGNLIELPKDASVIDFVYALDKELGNKAKKARVNGKVVPLWHTLNNGDLVEVLSGKKKRVSKVWLNFVVSAKARNEIQKHLKGKKPLKEKMPLINLELKAIDRIGLIKDFSEAFVSAGANIFSASIRTSDASRVGNDSFTLEIENPKKLKLLLTKLKKIKGVIEVKSNYIE